MTITTPTLVNAGLATVERIAPWAVNDYVEETGAAHEVKAAPVGAGKALYLTHVTMTAHFVVVIQDVKITLQESDGTVLYGPIQMQSDGEGLFKKDWKNPLKLTDNTALYVYGNVPGASFTLYVEGFTGDKPLG